jgi:mannose-6-phosphate isomerase-like protein (cupin superfamily)
MDDNIQFETSHLTEEMQIYAPDGSEIRLLSQTNRGSTCHCTLPPEHTSLAGMHQTVEEIWYIIEGQGQVWRKKDNVEEVVDVAPGVCLTIPVHTHFQFRTTGSEPLRFILTTMPPWPGSQEWVRVSEHWLVTSNQD